MKTQYSRERGIEQEKAQAILADLDRADEFDPSGNYFLAWDDDGREYLTCWGDDEPTAENTGCMSWASPGFPLPRRKGELMTYTVTITHEEEAILTSEGHRYVLDRNRGRWELSQIVKESAPRMTHRMMTYPARHADKPIGLMIPYAIETLGI